MLSWFKDIYRLDVYSLDASWVCSCSLNGSGWHMVESTLIVTNNCHSSFIDIYRVSFVVFYPSQKKWTPLHQTAGVFQPHQTADLLIRRWNHWQWRSEKRPLLVERTWCASKSDWSAQYLADRSFELQAVQAVTADLYFWTKMNKVGIHIPWRDEK